VKVRRGSRAGCYRVPRVRVHPARIIRVLYDIFTLGLYEIWYRRTVYAVEDSVRIERGLLSRTETHIPGNRINAVKTKLSPMPGSSKVLIDTGAGETAQAIWLTRADARAFAAACRELKARSEGGGRSSATSAPALDQ
jgi:membrane protein YdbS with pleckstrin-like domain